MESKSIHTVPKLSSKTTESAFFRKKQAATRSGEDFSRERKLRFADYEALQEGRRQLRQKAS